MALEFKKMAVQSHAGGQTVWTYDTADTLAGVTQPSYFEPAQDMLSVGDWLLITAADGATVRVVRSIDAALVVTVGLTP